MYHSGDRSSLLWENLSKTSIYNIVYIVLGFDADPRPLLYDTVVILISY